MAPPSQNLTFAGHWGEGGGLGDHHSPRACEWQKMLPVTSVNCPSLTEALLPTSGMRGGVGVRPLLDAAPDKQ